MTRYQFKNNFKEPILPNLFPAVDPNGLLEYSVVYTDRALNHMSQNFQVVMRDVSSILKEVYNAKSALVVPGSGTYGMEAVARQFASGKNVMVLRNGWAAFRQKKRLSKRADKELTSNRLSHQLRLKKSSRLF
jgi:hypothetical protein